ncbi:unnamed protein product [Closterium sp. NIES-53]
MDKELKALQERNTWKVVPIGVARNKTILTGKWVFRVKTKADGTIDKFKARWVVRGFDQEHGCDFAETFTPVSRHTSLRILLAIAALKKRKLRQIDVADAFSTHLSTQKSSSNFHTAPRLWQQYLHARLTRIGFQQLPHDQGMYRLTKGDDYILLIVYVDDLLYIGSTDKVTTWFEGELQRDLTLTVSSTVTQYLGLNIQEGEGAIYLNAAKYADTIAKRFALTPTTISTPYRYTSGNDKAESAPLKPAGIRNYQRKLGCLLFAAVTCRPDLSYSASQLATYLKRPEDEHMKELDRALHYLVSTLTIGLIYYKNITTTPKLIDYVNADHAGDPDNRRSRTVTSGAAGAGAGGSASAGGAARADAGGSASAGGAARVGAAGGTGAGAGVCAGGPAGAGAAGGTGAGGAAGVGADAEGTGVVHAGPVGAVRPRPYFFPLLEQPKSCPASSIRTARTSCRVPRPRPPALPGTHPMALRPSTAPQRVPLPSPPESSLPVLADPVSDSLCAANPTLTRLLATVVTEPYFESTAASALVTELVDFAAHCRLDYAASLVADSASVCPPSVGGECALSTDVLEDRQEEFQCFAAALPHLVSTLLAPEGDPDAPDIPTPRSYAEAIEGPYSSQWQAAMDAEMAPWKSTGTYVDEVPPPGANIVSGMWIFRVKRPPGSPPVFKARYVARGFSQRQGVDYFHTFSPTPKMTTLRVLLHVAAQRDYELHSLDFSTAFLQGSLHEEIWLRRPPGFTGSFPPGTHTFIS